MTSLTGVYSVIVPGAHLMSALLGQRDMNLRAIEEAFPAATIVATPCRTMRRAGVAERQTQRT